MKEIKFRGKVINDVECYGESLFRKGEWVYGYLVSPNVIVGDVVEIDEEYISLEWWVTVDPVTVGQSTDLKDKNNTEIYTGDILKLIAEDAMFTRQEWMGVVEFGNPNGTYTWGFQLRPLNGAEVNPDILLWVETELPNISCEIIGNIYENQELLKGGK